VHANDGVELAGLLIQAALKNQQVALRLRGDTPRDRIIGIDSKRRGLLHGGRVRIGMRQDEACETVCERCLADARWAADQPGMGNAAAFVGIKQRALGLRVTEQGRGFAWQSSLAVTIVVGAHGAVVSGTPIRSGCKRSWTIAHIRSDTTSRGA